MDNGYSLQLLFALATTKHNGIAAAAAAAGTAADSRGWHGCCCCCCIECKIFRRYTNTPTTVVSLLPVLDVSSRLDQETTRDATLLMLTLVAGDVRCGQKVLSFWVRLTTRIRKILIFRFKKKLKVSFLECELVPRQ